MAAQSAAKCRAILTYQLLNLEAIDDHAYVQHYVVLRVRLLIFAVLRRKLGLVIIDARRLLWLVSTFRLHY